MATKKYLELQEFKDADLIGIPIRVVLSKRSLKNGGAEFKLRKDSDSNIIVPEDVISAAKKHIELLFAEINEATEKAEKWK